MLVQKWLGGAVNLTKKTGLDHSAWHVSSKMACGGRLDIIDRLGGPYDEYDEMNLMKNMGLVTALGVSVQKWLGGAGFSGLISQVDPVG